MRISDWSSDVCSSDLFTRLEDKSEPGRSLCSILVLQHGQKRNFVPTGPNSRARQARFPNRHLGAIGMKALIAFDLDGTLPTASSRWTNEWDKRSPTCWPSPRSRLSQAGTGRNSTSRLQAGSLQERSVV